MSLTSSTSTTLPTTSTSSSSSSLYLQPLVLDIGGHSSRIGFAGSPTPKYTYKSLVGRLKHNRVMPGGALADGKNDNYYHDTRIKSGVYMGKTIVDHQGAFWFNKPIGYGGVVEDMSDLEMLFRHGFDQLGVRIDGKTSSSSSTSSRRISSGDNASSSSSLMSSTDHPLLIVENTTSPNLYQTRTHIAQHMFEEVGCPALFFAPSGVMSLYASGLTTGIVLDVGDTTSQVCPVYEGLGLHHSVKGNSIAGRRVTEELGRMLRVECGSRGVDFTTTAEQEVLNYVKDEIASIAKKDNNTSTSMTPKQTNATDQIDTFKYKLPDGTSLNIPATLKSNPFDLLFDPSIIGSDESSIQRLLTTSVKSCDLDIRSSLYSNIVLSGSTTLAPGFGDRLLTSVRELSPQYTKVRISAPSERGVAGYVGGSILGSLSMFREVCISKSVWEEEGERCVRKRMM